MDERFNPKQDHSQDFLDIINYLETIAGFPTDFKDSLVELVLSCQRNGRPPSAIRRLVDDIIELAYKQNNKESRMEKRLDLLIDPKVLEKIKKQAGQAVADEVVREKEEEQSYPRSN